MNRFSALWSKFKALNKWQKIVVVILILSVLGALSGTSETSTTSAQTSESQPKSEAPIEKTTIEKLNDYSVKWSNYAPVVKTRIASLIGKGDCKGLQTEFNNADRNNAAQQNRTGETNATLMSLLDDQMRNLGCY